MKEIKRKLAAILFADIVGYTALMQKDEATARQNLEKFRDTLNEKVAAHHGQIIQYYGDGCLCTFDSAVAATQCAKEVQQIFQSEPKVPVRIGLHSGDVFFEADNVYGDAVNIASRVESMGVAGSVLLSSSVQNQIKNQTDFELQSLGKFAFKNVEKEMTIYALGNEGFAIPKPAELQGKGQQIKTTNPFIRSGLIGLIVIALGAFLFWQFGASKGTNTAAFDTGILKERIAVLPFKNNTNQTELDILGDMAAEWINQGLMDIGEAEVVSPFTVRTHKAAIGILENDPQGRPSFAQLTGAQNLITGSYYLQNGELTFKLSIVDAVVGNLRFAFEPISGKVSEKEELITQLRQKVAGYWAARAMVDSKIIQAPKYEAYKIYLEALKERNLSAGNLMAILALDSTFYLPRIHYLNSNRIGTFGENKSHFEFLQRHHLHLSTYERGWLDFLEGLYMGKPIQAFSSLNEIRKKYPRDFILNHETAATALEGLNNPKLAKEIYDELPIKGINFEEAGVYYNWRILNYAKCLFRLGKISELDKFMSKINPNEQANREPILAANFLHTLAHKNQEAIEASFSNLNAAESPFMHFASITQILFSSLVSDNFRKKMVANGKKRFNQLPTTDVNRQVWKYLFSNSEVEVDALEISSQFPLIFQIIHLMTASHAVLEANDSKKVELIIEKLQQLNIPDYSISSRYGTAVVQYTIGRLYCSLGKYDQALYHLKKAKALDGDPSYTYYQYDRFLAPLHQHPEFLELIQPVWPEAKD